MLRLGIVDFDSSHCAEFTRRFNHIGVDRDQFVDGARVVAGWPGTSRMAPERIPGFVREVQECGVEIVDSPEALLSKVDGVMILSLAGDAHLERARPFLEAGIPTYVDKPFACSLRDAAEMIRLAESHSATLFHASALSYSADVLEFQRELKVVGQLHGALSYGPAKRDPGNPGLFHYGIHAAAILFALMGSGCDSVTNTWSDGTEVVTGRWADGRIGTLRGNRAGSTAYGFVAFCEQGVIARSVSSRYAYRNLCTKIVESIEKREPAQPVAAAFEMTRFMIAAGESERRGGESVRLESIHE